MKSSTFPQIFDRSAGAKGLVLPNIGAGEAEIARAMNACSSYTR